MAKDVIVTAWNSTTAQMRDFEVCVMGSVSSSRGYLSSIVGISSSEGIDVKRIYSAELPQDEVKLIKATTRVYRVAIQEEGDGREVKLTWLGNTFLKPVAGQGKTG
jgi:hypothetical protein